MLKPCWAFSCACIEVDYKCPLTSKMVRWRFLLCCLLSGGVWERLCSWHCLQSSERHPLPWRSCTSDSQDRGKENIFPVVLQINVILLQRLGLHRVSSMSHPGGTSPHAAHWHPYAASKPSKMPAVALGVGRGGCL